jgi:hypothetical protein
MKLLFNLIDQLSHNTSNLELKFWWCALEAIIHRFHPQGFEYKILHAIYFWSFIELYQTFIVTVQILFGGWVFFYTQNLYLISYSNFRFKILKVFKFFSNGFDWIVCFHWKEKNRQSGCFNTGGVKFHKI